MTKPNDISEELKKDMATLRIDIETLVSLTIKQAKNQYHKIALVTHLDKADPDNPKQVEEFTAAFKELGNSYERVFKYIVEKLQSKSEDVIEPQHMNDEDVFVRENFNKFNFPYENHGSFTVNVEDYLAGLWQECLEQVYGEPCIRINAKGTECDRLWKTRFGQEVHCAEITVHFYNHNKPKDKKQSKLLIQGGIQSSICEFVFSDILVINIRNSNISTDL